MGRKKTIEDEAPAEEEAEVVIEEETPEVAECDCDPSTRQSGFCPHGNNA